MVEHVVRQIAAFATENRMLQVFGARESTVAEWQLDFDTGTGYTLAVLGSSPTCKNVEPEKVGVRGSGTILETTSPSGPQMHE